VHIRTCACGKRQETIPTPLSPRMCALFLCDSFFSHPFIVFDFGSSQPHLSPLLACSPALCPCSLRDIPMPLVTSGVDSGNLREDAFARMRTRYGLRCRDVRTREVGIQDIHFRIKPDQVRRRRRRGLEGEGV